MFTNAEEVKQNSNVFQQSYKINSVCDELK